MTRGMLLSPLLAVAMLFFASSQNRTNGQETKDSPTKEEPKKIERPGAISDLKKEIDSLKAKAEASEKDVAELKTASAKAIKDAEEKAKGELEKAAKALEVVSKKANDSEATLAAMKKAADEKKEPEKKEDPLAKDVAAMKKIVLDDKGEDAVTAIVAGKLRDNTANDALIRGDSAWMLTSAAFVMLMIPGLALFYGGMVRRKNVLATMMQSYAALAVVGIFWVMFGYGLAFGPSQIKLSILGVTDGGIIGWDWKFFFMKGVNTSDILPGYNIPVYLHCMFQGMFAIITPALISGAIAERIRFWPFCIFMVLWVTLVYCPLAHMVWAFDWFSDVSQGALDDKGAFPAIGATAIGLLGKLTALDFAGGTVVHIAAGFAGLAGCIVLRKRAGFPDHPIHPNSMVLTLIGAGLLWFGWFGFNGGSATNAMPLATSAFAATQAAAAAAGLSWIFVEWLIKGKPTALGLASGIVAGLVAVTPASGFVYVWGGVVIGLIAGVVCYFSVYLKSILGYDDSLDAFGVHGVGGFLGAVLTGFLCYSAVNLANTDGYVAINGLKARPLAIESEAKNMVKSLPDLTKKITEADKALADLEAKPVTDPEDKKKDYDGKVNDAKSDIARANAMYRLTLTKIRTAVGKGDLAADMKSMADTLPPLEKAVKDAEAAVAAEEKKFVGKKPEEVETGMKEVKAALASAQATFDGEKKYSDDLAADISDDDTDLGKAKAVVRKLETDKRDGMTQPWIQLKAACFSAAFAFVMSLILFVAVQAMTLGNLSATLKDEATGLDQVEHGEVGFDFTSVDSIPSTGKEPRAAKAPPGTKRFSVAVDGIENGGLMKVWKELCQPTDGPIDPDFKAIYPFVTTVQDNRFRFRGGDSATLSLHVQKLFTRKLSKAVKVRITEG